MSIVARCVKFKSVVHRMSNSEDGVIVDAENTCRKLRNCVSGVKLGLHTVGNTEDRRCIQCSLAISGLQ